MQKKGKINVQDLTRLALVTAIYAVLTVVTSELSYNGIQYRLSEVLVLLCFYRKAVLSPICLALWVLLTGSSVRSQRLLR